MSGLFSRIAAAAASRRREVVAIAAFLSLIGVVAALRLETDASTSTIVDRGSETSEATEDLRASFGDDAIAVLVQTDEENDLRDLMLTEDLGQLLRFEGCLAGEASVTDGQSAASSACSEIAASDNVRVVYGPATFLNQAASQAGQFLSEQSQATLAQAQEAAATAVKEARKQGFSEEEAQQAGVAAGQAIIGDFQNSLLQLAIRYGQTGLPSLDDPQFVSQVVFDTRLGDGEPKSRFAYLFPSPDSALVTVRLEPGLSTEERSETIEQIREAAADEGFALKSGDYVVSGVPVVVDEASSTFTTESVKLLIASVIVMALVLALVFGPPRRLLPLALALLATAVTFGLLSILGGSLTAGSLAVLPILIGLAVDYSIQFQARFREAVGEGRPRVEAARVAASRGGPTIAIAALATIAGFLVLLIPPISPVPMLRDFGLLLVVGIVLAFTAALTVGLAVLVGEARGGQAEDDEAERGRIRDRLVKARDHVAGSSAVASFTRLRDSAGRGVQRATSRSLAFSIADPGRMLALAAIVAVGGWVASTQTDVASDPRQLVPGSVLEDAGVPAIEKETGVSGELNVIVTAPDVTDPEVVAWMADVKGRILERGGFGGEFPSCEAAQICPQIAISDLFTEGAGPLDQERIDTVLDAVPPYFSQAVITRDAETGELGNTANIAFGIRVGPLDQQENLIEAIREEISDAPPGVDARVAGLPALFADANADLERSRFLLTGAALLAVALTLFAFYRSLRRALIPLIPIVLATGWAGLVVWVARVDLNPMSTALGLLVIAISTEFSVLLSARFFEERDAGRSVGEALRETYDRTGKAVLASGVTAIAGFAVLIASGIPMLRDFGLVTVVDLSVTLIGVMLVLPAALVFAESRTLVTDGLRTRTSGT